MEKAMECPRCDSEEIAYGLVDRIPALFISLALAGLVITTIWTLIKIALAH